MNLFLKSVCILISANVCLSTAQNTTTQGPVDYHTRLPAAGNQFPYMVYIYMDFEDFGTLFQCGGVILDENHVLTSASCFVKSPDDTIDINNIYVTAGNNTQPDTTHVYRIIYYDIMVSYSPAQYINDLIMLQVSPGFIFTSQLSPISVSNSWNVVSDICVLPTWFDGMDWDYLYWNAISQFDCASTGTLLYCAGDPTQLTAVTTPADVGSAMVCNNTLVGLVTMNEESQYLTNLTDHYNWIQQQLGRVTSTTAGSLSPVPTTNTSAVTVTGTSPETTVTAVSTTPPGTNVTAVSTTPPGTNVTTVPTTLPGTNVTAETTAPPGTNVTAVPTTPPGTNVTGVSTTSPGTTVTGISPQTTVTAPQTTVTAPQTTVTAPQTTVTAPQTTVTAPQTTVTATDSPTTVLSTTIEGHSSAGFNALVTGYMLIFAVFIVTTNAIVCVNVM